MRRIGSLSPIRDPGTSRGVAGQNVRKVAVFSTFSLATERLLLGSRIGEWEMIYRIGMQLFLIHYFRVQ